MSFENIFKKTSLLENSAVVLWGCELTNEMPTYSFDLTEGWPFKELLALRMISLGANAKDEYHEVEVIPTNYGTESDSVVIASLKPSVLPMASSVGFDLSPPVMFRLKTGSGPVHLAGLYQTVFDIWDEEEEKAEKEEGKEEEEDEEDDSLLILKLDGSSDEELQIDEMSVDEHSVSFSWSRQKRTRRENGESDDSSEEEVQMNPAKRSAGGAGTSQEQPQAKEPAGLKKPPAKKH